MTARSTPSSLRGTGSMRRVPPHRTGAGDFFVLGRHGSTRANPFEDVFSLTLPDSADFPAGIDVYAGASATIHHRYDPVTHRAVYVWGDCAHQTIADRSRLLASIIAGPFDQLDARLRELLGVFVLVIDDRRARRVIIASDVLGLRPFFVGQSGGRLVGGSDVLKICRAGLSSGEVNYDAVGSWLRYNQIFTDDAVVTDYTRLAPSTAITFYSAGTVHRRAHYAPVSYSRKHIDPDDLSDLQYTLMSQGFEALMRDAGDVNLPLSGGYDSRFIAALAVERPHLSVYLQTLNTREHEIASAREVSKALRHPMVVVPSRGRILDLFDDPFAPLPGGFIVGRNLSSAVARRLPGVRMLCGFLGDGVIRGSATPAGQAFWAKDDANLSVDGVVETMDAAYFMAANRLHLLNDDMQRRVDNRARAHLRPFAKAGHETGKPLLHTSLFGRQRAFYGNVALQPLEATEVIAPFCTWAMLNCRTDFSIKCYDGNNYPNLFRRKFPPLDGILPSWKRKALSAPHAPRKPRAVRHLRRWTTEIGAALMTGSFNGLRRRAIAHLLPSALAGEPKYEKEITFLYKLLQFERSLDRAGIRFDWKKL